MSDNFLLGDIYPQQENGTEPPFQNEYWDNKRAGIYVDISSGEPLFSSLDKFDSGAGWLSFTKSIEGTKLIMQPDVSPFGSRTEVRSKKGNNHLGHVFDDGPEEAGGKRFCINLASLRFVPLEDMEKEGYGKYLSIFKTAR